MKNINVLKQLSELKKEDCIHQNFDFCAFNHFGHGLKTVKGIPNCSTSGCLAGELPSITNDWYFNEYGGLKCREYPEHTGDVFDRLALYFGLSLEEVEHLFQPNSQSQQVDPNALIPLDSNSTIEQVQENLKSFLKFKNL